MPAQAQKHVTHNEALMILDHIIHLQVEASLSEPPDDVLEHARYLVQGASPEGVWAQKDTQIASRLNGIWQFTAPNAGWLCWDKQQQTLLAYTGDSWIGVGSHQFSRLGIGTQPDDINKFALKSQASLFDNNGADHRLVVNKHGSIDTASIVFQQSYAGQTEIGLNGTNDFSIRVSSDGENWITALTISSDSGNVSIHRDVTRDGAQILDANNTADILNVKGSIGGNEDLNDYDATGMWHQPRNANAATGDNYPNAYAGLLTVVSVGAMVYQTYRVYSSAGSGLGDATFTRGRYLNRWSNWQRLQAE